MRKIKKQKPSFKKKNPFSEMCNRAVAEVLVEIELKNELLDPPPEGVAACRRFSVYGVGKRWVSSFDHGTKSYIVLTRYEPTIEKLIEEVSANK